MTGRWMDICNSILCCWFVS